MNYDRNQLCRNICENTIAGPIFEWVDRLKNLSIKVGLDANSINWNQSADVIIFDIIKKAESTGRLETLRNLVGDVNN